MRVLFWLVAVGLAAPAVALTAGRLVSADAGLLIRLQAFTPLGVPLYAALTALLVAGAWARSGAGRARRIGGAALAAAGLVVHGWWFAPQVVGDAPDAAEDTPTTTVMTANLYEGRGDAEDVVAAVRGDDVELLVLSEITPDALARLDAAGLAELLPHRAGVAEEFVAGTMVFATEPIAESALLATTFNAYRVELGGTTLLAVHPAAPTLPFRWRADHDLIREEALEVGADMIVGDLNATPDHPVMRSLGDSGYRSAAELANEGWLPTWPTGGVGRVPFLPPSVQIDHVLVARSMTALDARTVDVTGSDHLALIAEVAEVAEAAPG